MRTDTIITKAVDGWRAEHKLNVFPKDSKKSNEDIFRNLTANFLSGMVEDIGISSIMTILENEIEAWQESEFGIRSMAYQGGGGFINRENQVRYLKDLVLGIIKIISRNLLLTSQPKDIQSEMRRAIIGA